MSDFTVLGSAGPVEVGYGGGRTWIAGLFLSVADTRRLAELAAEAADRAEAEPAEPEPEHPATPGLFL